MTEQGYTRFVAELERIDGAGQRSGALYVLSCSDFVRHDPEGNVLVDSRTIAAKPEVGSANYCLCDFVAPKTTGVRVYVGAFTVTTGLGIEQRLALFEATKDDYSANGCLL